MANCTHESKYDFYSNSDYNCIKTQNKRIAMSRPPLGPRLVVVVQEDMTVIQAHMKVTRAHMTPTNN